MFKSVTVTNYRGDSLELPLEWPNDAGLLISKIDGITPGNVQVNSQDYALLDGGVYNSSRMETRNITIEFYYGFNPHIESSRHLAYRYFPVKTEVRLDFLTDERHLSIWGYVESNDTQIFSQQEKGQVSIVCVDPYFYEQTPVSYIIGSSTKEFEFPWSNESLTEPLICFGDYGPRALYEVNYQGDIEVGAVIRVHFKKIQTVPKITIFDVSHNKKLVLDFEDIKSKTSVTLIGQYSDIVFSSVRGQKDIYYERYGQRKSIIGAFDVMNFPWMYLTPGENLFGYDAEQQYLDEFEITIEHTGAYGGV
jgi:hypothetical protein